ncbi:MAG: phosphate ABC transporter permease PstA [Candidatus Aenigmatarchaeota archaeon]
MIERQREEKIFKNLSKAMALMLIGVLAIIIGTIVYKGFNALSLNILTNAGRGGGILHAIVGTIWIGGGGTALAFAISFPTALYLAEYDQGSRFSRIVRLLLDTLMGLPSIVLGIFGYFVLVSWFGLGYSMIGGIIVIAIFETPLMTNTMEEVISMVPDDIREASYALGASKIETSLKVTLRQAWPGILTSIIISFGRGVGETAPLLFVAGFSGYIPLSPFQETATLPTAIWFYFDDPETQSLAFAAAFVLILMVLSGSVISRYLSQRLEEKVEK